MRHFPSFLPQLSNHWEDDGNGEEGKGHGELGEAVGERHKPARLARCPGAVADADAPAEDEVDHCRR